MAIRSGGHNALGFGNIDDGVVIDVSRLDQVELLGEDRVRIGAGATWGPAAAALAEHGLAITSGDTVSVGVGGLTQAGGIGWMVRKHGLTIDSLLAAEVVTAAGDVVRASATENPDLFWALRGGAGNFGVVTAFEFQAQPVTTVQFGTITFALDDVAQLLKGWAAAMRSAPEELSSTLVLMPGIRRLPGRSHPLRLPGRRRHGGTRAAPRDRHGRRRGRQRAAVRRDPRGGAPAGGHAARHRQHAGRVRRRAAIEAIATAYASGGRVVFLRSLGGAVGRVDPSDTAFAHRTAEALVVSAAFLPGDADGGADRRRPLGVAHDRRPRHRVVRRVPGL